MIKNVNIKLSKRKMFKSILVLAFFIIFFLFSCSPYKKIDGNYYCICYFDFNPSNVIKIASGEFELYSPNIIGEKYIGKIQIKEDALYLYREYDLVNDFNDTLVSVDTSKYGIKGKKIIPFDNAACYYKKTKDKSKVFQLPPIGN